MKNILLILFVICSSQCFAHRHSGASGVLGDVLINGIDKNSKRYDVSYCIERENSPLDVFQKTRVAYCIQKLDTTIVVTDHPFFFEQFNVPCYYYPKDLVNTEYYSKPFFIRFENNDNELIFIDENLCIPDGDISFKLVYGYITDGKFDKYDFSLSGFNYTDVRYWPDIFPIKGDIYIKTKTLILINPLVLKNCDFVNNISNVLFSDYVNVLIFTLNRYSVKSLEILNFHGIQFF